MFRWLFGFVLAVGLATGGVVAWGYAEYLRPGPYNIGTTIIIDEGTGVDAIARDLQGRGLIRSAFVFRAGLRLLDPDKTLKAGEYAIPPSLSPRAFAGRLDGGKTVVRRLTVAEGLTTAQILAQLRATEGLSGEIRRRPDEGSLLPETYHFSYGDTREQIVGRMRVAMADVLEEIWRRRAPGLPVRSPAEAVILASIIEKETGRADERQRVAGVFVNRLNKGMRLQSDPTVVYGLTDGQGPLGRGLTRADLAKDHPFNTYVIRGLPPGPIANPGRASLEAAVNPAATGDLYFVADGKGGHLFARTLREHNANVAKWRRIERERRSAQ